MKQSIKSKMQLASIVCTAAWLFGFSAMVGASNHSVEEISACVDNQQGDSCSFNNENGETVNGSCHGEGSSGEGVLYCKPTS